MAITAEMLDKVSEIVRTELPKRLPDSIRVRRVDSEIWPGIENEIIHVLVFYEGDRKDLNPRMLNQFDLEIEPMLLDIGVDDVVPISYTNRKEVGELSPAPIRELRREIVRHELGSADSQQPRPRCADTACQRTYGRGVATSDQHGVLRHVPRIGNQQRGLHHWNL